MKKKGYLIGALAAGALLFTLNTDVQAATVPISNNGTSYIRKGNKYRFYFKAPMRLTVNTKAKYKIVNTSNWECIPYKGSNKNTKVFYLRAGHYNLTTKSGKNLKIKTSATRITKLRHKLETFSYKTYSDKARKPIPIKIGQTVNGMADMYRTEDLNTRNYYRFTINKDQKVTMNLSVLPVYKRSRTNISDDTQVWLIPDDHYGYSLNQWKIKGSLKDGTYSWNLEKGTYDINFGAARGRYQFKLSSDDTNALPGTSKLTNIASTEDGIKVDYTKADNATGYGIYCDSVTRSKEVWHNPYLDAIRFVTDKFPDALTQTISKSRLVNGNTYDIAVRARNDEEGHSYGPVSADQKFTYYVPLKGSHEVPRTPKLEVSYYDDHGSDEPAIELHWDINPEVDSYEIQYRPKGNSQWKSYFTKQDNWDEITEPSDDFGQDFKKGQIYEVRIRALRSNLMSNWTDIKTTRVTVTPNR